MGALGYPGGGKNNSGTKRIENYPNFDKKGKNQYSINELPSSNHMLCLMLLGKGSHGAWDISDLLVLFARWAVCKTILQVRHHLARWATQM
jgi:hypothetical protein